MRMRIAMIVAVGLVAAGLAAVPATPAAAGTDLLQPTVGAPERALDRHAVRERAVTVDLAQLAPGARLATVRFNLFDDTVVDATRERVELRGPGNHTWIGEVDGYGYAIVSVVEGVVAARIVDESGTQYAIRYAGDGVHLVVELDPSSFPRSAEPLLAPAPPGSVSPAPVRAVQVETYIDVLVVYTKRSKNQRGGQAGIEAAITTAVTETNEAFSKSGIGVELRLVDTRQVDYTESGDSENDLDRVTKTSDGHMDEVHGWRDATGADMVALIVDNDDWCGIAWTMDVLAPWFESHAFSVVAEDCVDYESTMGHEWGHNFGANHEREVVIQTDPSLTTVFQYAFGWFYSHPDDGFRTVMAYGDFCSPDLSACPFLNRFSNPAKNFRGVPIGDADADNARTIRNTAPTIADFRAEVGGGNGGGTETCAGLPATHTAADAVNGVIKGTKNDDVIVGSEGADVIRGKGGDDTICSLGGKDTVYGNAGHDTIYGGAQQDVLKGGSGKDHLFGEGGKDKLYGNKGKDEGDGGKGTDTCVSVETATSCEA